MSDSRWKVIPMYWARKKLHRTYLKSLAQSVQCGYCREGNSIIPQIPIMYRNTDYLDTSK